MIQTDYFPLLHDSYVYVPQEEAIPELEIDVDELLDMENDVDRAARVKVSFSKMSDSIFYHHLQFLTGLHLYDILSLIVQQDLLVDCYKPTEVSKSSHI